MQEFNYADHTGVYNYAVEALIETVDVSIALPERTIERRLMQALSYKPDDV
jgi:hypothetical protein